MNYYNIYGLSASSPIELSNWKRIPEEEHVDFRIEFKRINDRYFKKKKETLIKPFSHFSPEHYFLDIEGVAKYFVKRKSIQIELYENSSMNEALLFFEENVLSVLLQFNDIFLFEACGIRTNSGVSLICGSTSTGKSTLLASLLNIERKFIADDKCLIYWNKKTGTWNATAFVHRIHQWKDKNAIFNKKIMYPPSQIRANIDKHEFKLKKDFIGEEGEVKRIILITISNSKDTSIDFEEIKGISKINSLKNYSHLFHLTRDLGKSKQHFEFISKVAMGTKLYSFNRSKLTTFAETLKYFNDENIIS